VKQEQGVRDETRKTGQDVSLPSECDEAFEMRADVRKAKKTNTFVQAPVCPP
jgi:hypothetical protein